MFRRTICRCLLYLGSQYRQYDSFVVLLKIAETYRFCTFLGVILYCAGSKLNYYFEVMLPKIHSHKMNLWIGNIAHSNLRILYFFTLQLDYCYTQQKFNCWLINQSFYDSYNLGFMNRQI